MFLLTGGSWQKSSSRCRGDRVTKKDNPQEYFGI